jgi:hypothetical protein
MKHTYPSGQGAPTSPNQPVAQPIQASQQSATRGRGRRQYAAQQYDFSSPTPASYNQQPVQPQYPAQGYPASQGYQQSQTIPSLTQTPYGQPQTYPQPGYQYGQEYQQSGSDLHQQGYQGPQGVSDVTKQFQNLHIAQVQPFTCVLTIANSH